MFKLKKRTFIFFCSVLVIGLFWGMLQVSADTADHYFVKVGLKYGNNGVSHSTIYSEHGFKIGTLSDRFFIHNHGSTDSKTINVKIHLGEITVTDSSMNTLFKGPSVCLMPDSPGEGKVTVDGSIYRGGIEYLSNKNGTMNIINYVNIESYVYGVINAEMGHKYPLDALKSQAVCARSYVYNSQYKHKAEGFDICTTAHCQSYKGVSGEYPITNKSVDETKGEILYYNKTPIVGYYFANSGGHTLNVEDVWYAALPYLRAVKDEFSPEYKWTYKINKDTLGRKLGIGSVKSVNILDRTYYGSINSIEFVGTKGSKILKKDGIRTTLGANNIKSRIFSVEGANLNNNNAAGLYITNGNQTIIKNDVFIINGTGKTVRSNPEKTFISNGKLIIILKTLLKPSLHGQSPTNNSVNIVASGNTPNTVSKNNPDLNKELIFTGYGYGHGVGLPQQSAKEMALKGYDYKQILKKYFTGAEIAPM